MDIKLKHRLVGACVILALAVFFLPMILDSEKYNQEIESKIPEQATLNITSQDGDEGSITINLDEDEPEKAIQVPAKIEEIESQTSSEPQDASEANITDENTSEAKIPSQVTKTENDNNDKPVDTVDNTKPRSTDSADEQITEPVATETKETVEESVVADDDIQKTPETAEKPDFAEKAWVIQIGSFSNKANATSLVAELRNKGFRAYQRDAKEYTRVFVGPYPDQSAAEKRTEGLEKIVGAAVKVIEFDPQDH
ncbi:SPOR domain-containing protein [Kangiella geojedonensis]|uniref:Sporulation domain protein n=1 Tax=Kangiella geojedonensis TaxID=914150 RepID=A0A0F6TQA0_9GAMM|nr:SPOR domain-containing protein [Kangiella geojedonensis]AKE51932.1 Sporulation domain protein [Kangiella geojedonensis]